MPSMTITLHRLRVRTTLGAYPHEQTSPRTITLDVAVTFDPGAALLTDQLSDTLDYAQIETRIVDYVAGKRFALVETLASQVAACVLADARIQEVTVQVHKPEALRHAEGLSVYYTATRQARGTTP